MSSRVDGLPMLRESERTLVLIDGIVTHELRRYHDFSIDFGRFHDLFFSRTNLVRVNYYTVIGPQGWDDRLKGLLSYLSHNGYNVITREGDVENKAGVGMTVTGGMSVDITVDMMNARKANIDHIVLLVSDVALVKAITEVKHTSGIKTTLLFARGTTPNALIRSCDWAVNLADIRTLIERRNDDNEANGHRLLSGRDGATHAQGRAIQSVS